MELASMLAGEPFGDHPACASPVIAALLRAYNDALDDERRQDLYRYAAMVVGTRAGDDVERERRALCAAWLRDVMGERRRSRWRHWRLSHATHAARRPTGEEAGSACGRGAGLLVRYDGDVAHARVLAFVDRLVAERAPKAPAAGRHASGPLRA